jgi:hypothetical protein
MRTGGSGMDLYKDKDTIAAGRRHTVGLKSDRTVRLWVIIIMANVM